MPMTKYVELALNVPLNSYFDYAIDKLDAMPPIGSRVLVPFGKQQKIAIVTAHKTTTQIAANKIKQVEQLLEPSAISKEMLDLYKWCSNYYCRAPGEIIVGCLPRQLRLQYKRKQHYLNVTPNIPSDMPVIAKMLRLNKQQQIAVDAVLPGNFAVHLLDGVTGSGKTEVYMHLIAKVMPQQVLVLVPEIGLTPQTYTRFENYFPGMVAVIHSNLSPGQKLKAWQRAKNTDAKIILGTRSAVFTDIPDLGAIIIDEEHDLSFKQQDGFCYHARSVAIMRAKFNKIPIVLGSATPAFDSLYNAAIGKYQHLRLSQRAGDAQLPVIEIIDTSKLRDTSSLAPSLITQIKQVVAQKQQVLIFLNKRGYMQTVYCQHCGWICSCKHCDARMTLHLKRNIMRCHHCNYTQAVPDKCNSCQHPDLITLGAGTEKVAEDIARDFHGYRIMRLDSDTMQHKGELAQSLDKIHRREVDIVIGTQMIAKGHHFRNCAMVVIVNMDQCLFSPNYRNIEYGGQMILQIAGRCGRDSTIGRVYLQSTCPDHPCLQPLLSHDYHKFYAMLMRDRQSLLLPPYCAWAYIKVRSKVEHGGLKYLQQLRHWMLENIKLKFKCYQPDFSPMVRKSGMYQAEMCIEAQDKSQLQHVYSQISAAPKSSVALRLFLDIDPA